MGKKLVRHGNSLALVIDRGILDLLKIEAETPLELFTDGDVLVVKPSREPEREERLQAARKKIHGKYADVFRRLAE